MGDTLDEISAEQIGQADGAEGSIELRVLVQRSATANSVSGPAPWFAGLNTSNMRRSEGWR